MSESCMQHIEDFWKKKTNAANQLLNEGKHKEALLVYEEALYRAEVLNNHQSDAIDLGIPFIQVFAISCNNIAFTYEEMGQIEKSKKMLERVVYYFLYLTKGKQVDLNEIQSELKRAILTYKEFVDRNGIEMESKKNMLSDIQEHLDVKLSI